jgi:hypothetical protein
MTGIKFPTNDIQQQISCWNDFPFISQQCWVQAIAKGLGLIIILGSCFNKAPVLINLYRSRSSTGMSRGATYSDVIGTCNRIFSVF